jgi:hypothetical protein
MYLPMALPMFRCYGFGTDHSHNFCRPRIVAARPRLGSTIARNSIMALTAIHKDELQRWSASAFLDVWATEDSIERLRLLWKRVPREQDLPLAARARPSEQISEPVRRLGNVADDLGQQANTYWRTRALRWARLSGVPGLIKSAPEVMSCLPIPEISVEADLGIMNPSTVTD